MDNRNARGSEWRKWDLHVHTPFTKLNNGYKVESEAQVWDLFCKKLEDSDVFAFGITDYFSVENYCKFLDKFKHKFSDSHKAFFPNIEFRIDSKNKGGDHIQIHVLFSNESNVLKKFDDFFTRLKLFSTDDKNLTHKYCTKEDLEKLEKYYLIKELLDINLYPGNYRLKLKLENSYDKKKAEKTLKMKIK